MKCLFLALLAAVSLPATGQSKQTGSFTFTGKVTNLREGYVYLRYSDKDGKYINDSAALQNGAFRFSGRIAEPTMAGFSGKVSSRSMDDPNCTMIFLEPGNMKVMVADKAFKQASITGSISQQEYTGLQVKQEKIQKCWAVVMDTLNEVNKRSNFEYQELKKWVLTPYSGEMKVIQADFIKKHPSSYVTAFLLRISRDYSTDELKKIYARFPVKVQQSAYGKAILTDLKNRKKGVPGAMAAGFSTSDIAGKPISLSDFKGKYVLVDFWASWCLPCRKGNPHLKELYSQYKDKGFEIIGVSDDDTKPDAWRTAVAKDALPWKHVLRGMKMTREGDKMNIDHAKDISEGYNVHSLPTQVLIDPDGKIIGRYGEGADAHEDLDKKLAEVFKDLALVTFTGTVDPAFNGEEVVIYNRAIGVHDSAMVKDGRFTFTAAYKEPGRYMFYSKAEVKKKHGYSPWGILVTKPGEVQMKMVMDSISATTVRGAAENDIYNVYAAAGNEANKKIMARLEDKYGKEYMDNLTPEDPKYKDFVADYQGMMQEGKPAETARLEQFITDNNHSFAAMYILSSSSNGLDADKLEALYNKLSPDYIPSTLLIDPKGEIVAKNLRGELLHKKLAEIFD